MMTSLPRGRYVDDVVSTHDEREVAADVDGLDASHAALVEHLRGTDPVDPSTPSRLPNWTIGHVLTHLARNADSQHRMLAGFDQYPHGREGRDADIEAGSGRSWGELVGDVERTCAAVSAAFASVVDWGEPEHGSAAPRPRSMLAFARQREVEVHRADLGLGYGFGDMPSRYVRMELRLMEMLWKANKPMGMTPLPDLALQSPPHVRLAWLMGRTEIDGLAPAGIF
jgi:maleylpyruvate isomerase